MKTLLTIFIVAAMLAGTWFLSAQDPPVVPPSGPIAEGVVEDPTAPPGAPTSPTAAPPAFPATIPVINANPEPAATTPAPVSPIMQPPRPRTTTQPPSLLPNRGNNPSGLRPGVRPGVGLPNGVPPPMMTMPGLPKADNTSTNGSGEIVMDGDVEKVTFRWNNAPIEQVLDFYADLVGRIVVRAQNVGTGANITIKTQEPLTREEAIQVLDTIFAANSFSTVPVGDKMISLVPQDKAGVEGGAFGGNAGKLPEAAQFTTQVVKLTNAIPSEVATILKDFSKIPNGITPLDGSGILVLRDYAVNVKRMMEMVERIDKVTESAYKLEVIPIKYGKVADIYDVMSGLIGGSGGSTSGTRSSTRSSSRTSRSSSSRTSTTSNRMGMNNSLNNANQLGGASTPTSAVNNFQRNLQSIVNRAALGDSQILGDAKVLPDERANSLVVYADKRDMDVLTNIVAKLDVALAQVLIEAVVMEVSLDHQLKFGVNATQQPKSSGKFTGGGIMNNGQALPIGSGSAFGSTSNNASSFLGNSGLSYLGSFGNNFDVMLEALSSDSTVNVISKPRIQTTHAVEANFFVGDTVPYVTGTSGGYYNGGVYSQYQEKEVGVSLTVTPYITPDGLVVMEIQQEISSLGTPMKIDGNDVPTTTKRQADSTVSVEDGKTILLGGYIMNTKTKSNSGVPVLKDIPLLGNLFRSKSDKNQRTEVMVLMRPTVLKRPEDAAIAADIERRRLPGVRASEREFMQDEQLRLDKEERLEQKAQADKKKKKAK